MYRGPKTVMYLIICTHCAILHARKINQNQYNESTKETNNHTNIEKQTNLKIYQPILILPVLKAKNIDEL